jgi:hypothetical protein
VTEPRFLKSSYSAASGECAEVATNVPDSVVVRDSKAPAGPYLRLRPASWAAFLSGIRVPEA